MFAKAGVMLVMLNSTYRQHSQEGWRFTIRMLCFTQQRFPAVLCVVLLIVNRGEVVHKAFAAPQPQRCSRCARCP